MVVDGVNQPKAIDACLDELLAARNEAGALEALRRLFVGEMDFQHQSATLPLEDDGLPQSATLLASRDGVYIVAVRLPAHGRVLVRSIRAALAQVERRLNGDALLAAGSDDGSEWQLVYPSTSGDREILRRITLHRNQPHRTVAEQLAGVYDEAAKSDLRNALERAYDVEAVTKRFFTEYRGIFEAAMSRIEGLPKGDERRLFCQTLFNRLMFIYFLQRKGWLQFEGQTDYLHALWKARERSENFYESRLKPLFFTALNNERTGNWDRYRATVEQLIGKVPFLNGGLFTETPLDRRAGVQVPDGAIEPILNDLFRRFNFTIAESTPYDVQVAVDPEMLGSVFEELVTGRHETGSYYTPRPIVSFMCREALKGYLSAKVPDLDVAAVERYVEEHDISGIDRDQAGRILDALEGIAVVDPACGSGAYLLGMMQELLDLQVSLFNPGLLTSPKSVYDMKLRIIERNVYGVDIDRFAVNIAMLRLWLSLIVEYEGSGDPPPLPNLDFKIACGDSLTGPDPRQAIGDMFRARAHDLAIELSGLKAEYMKAVGPNKDDLRGQIETAMRELSERTAHSDVPAEAVDWRVVFAEVFERGGFDVVVANPPYVRQELIRDQKPRLKRVYGSLYSGTADLYVYFYYRALQLLGSGGMLVFISSNKWFRAAYGAKLRDLLATGAAVRSITDFGDLPVFEAATAYPMIFIAQRAGSPRAARYTQVPSLQPPYPDVHALAREYGFDLPPEAIDGAGWRLTRQETIDRLDRMRVGTIPLGEYVGGQIYYGVKTGFNKAFVIDGATRDALIAADPASAEIIKPFIVGRDIRRWRVEHRDRWLIVTRIGTDMCRYPAVFDHLERWQPELERRWDKGEHWWELRACAYYDAFDVPKIVFPDIAKEARFALDRSGVYSTNTTYVLPSEDPFLLGLLNSQPVADFFMGLGALIRGGYLRFCDQYVEQIPIPTAAPADRAAIEQLVARCLDARGDGPLIAEWEAEIDARVARLYGLHGQSEAAVTGTVGRARP